MQEQIFDRIDGVGEQFLTDFVVIAEKNANDVYTLKWLDEILVSEKSLLIITSTQEELLHI